jgi:hypothetical protein
MEAGSAAVDQLDFVRDAFAGVRRDEDELMTQDGQPHLDIAYVFKRSILALIHLLS